MPTTIIHEIVGRKIANHYKYLDNYNFYLGCTAPDSVNLDGFAPKIDRWTAHLRDADLNVWKNNIISFYKSNKENYDLSFLKGYTTHILTDIIFDEKFYERVTYPMVQINLTGHDAHKYMLEEMNAYGRNNEDYNYTINILNKSNETYSIRNISKELLYNWKQKIINQQLPDITPKFITESIVEELYEEVEKELIEYNVL